MAELLPLGVYSEFGSRGQASLTIVNPGGQSPGLGYILSLDRKTSCWSIRADDELQARAVLLDKKALLTAISPLRQCRNSAAQ